MQSRGKLLAACSVALVSVAGLTGVASASTAHAPVPTVTGVFPRHTPWNAPGKITVTGTGFRGKVKVILRPVDENMSGYPLAKHVQVESATRLRFRLAVHGVGASLVPGGYFVRVKSTAGRSTKTSRAVLRLTNIISGSPWRARLGPIPRDAETGPERNGSLRDLACSNPSRCVAWGYYDTPDAFDVALLAKLAHGSWTTAPVRLPIDIGKRHRFGLLDSSCGASGNCAVLGHYSKAHVGRRAFVERLVHGSWRANTIPVPAGRQADQHPSLHSVSCAGHMCAAVGDADGRPAISTLVHGTWHTHVVPTPAGHTGRGHLFSVSCPTASSCRAVGQFHTAAGHAGSLVEVLRNGKWRPSKLPLPPGAAPVQGYYDTVTHISCGSPKFCAAYGTYRRTGGGTRAMLLALHHGRWRVVTAPMPHTRHPIRPGVFGGYLGQISCAPARTCVVLVSFGPDSVPATTETYRHGRWRAALVRLPSDRRGGEFESADGVTCYAAGKCMVSGAYDRVPSAGFVTQPFVARLDGTWSTAAIPTPGKTDIAGELWDIWCSTQRRCVAVGDVGSGITADYSDPMIATLRKSR